MDKTALLTNNILLGVDEENNVLRLENCMTRTGMGVQDDGRIDIPRLRQLPGVNGYVEQGARHQIIVGPGKAAKVMDAMRSLIVDGGERAGADDIERTKSEAKAKYKAPMSDTLRKLTSVFTPLTPAFIAPGLITGIINILKRPNIVGDFATHYPNVLGLIGIFGNAVFATMNVLVRVNTAKVFGGSLATSRVMAEILSSPQLAQITLFGEALQPGCGGVIAMLLMVALVCWTERRLHTLLPKSPELILNPLLTTIIADVVAIVALQPLGGWISESIVHGALQAIDRGDSLIDAVLTGILLPLVLTGLHQGLVLIHVELVQTHGYNAFSLILAMVDVGQIDTAIAVLMKTRNVWLEEVIRGVLSIGLLGIGEPLISGITLSLGRPSIDAYLGGTIDGTLISYWRTVTVITFGISGLSLALTVAAGRVMFCLLGYLVAVIIGFLSIWLLGFADSEE